MIPGNEVESSQTTSHYIQNSSLLWCSKEWILVGYPLTDGTLLGSFLLQQKVIEQSLWNWNLTLMVVNLCSAVYPGMM